MNNQEGRESEAEDFPLHKLYKCMYFTKMYLSNAVVAKKKAARQDEEVSHDQHQGNTYKHTLF